MKNIFIVLLMAFAIPVLAQNDTLGYVVSIKKGKFLKKDGIKYYAVPVTLTNATKDTLHYASWSCSWQDFYSTDNPHIIPEDVPCDKNIPERLSLPPGKKRTVLLTLKIKDQSSGDITFRIGHNIVRVYDKYILRDWKELRKTKNIIWSNPITIKPK